MTETFGASLSGSDMLPRIPIVLRTTAALSRRLTGLQRYPRGTDDRCWDDPASLLNQGKPSAGETKKVMGRGSSPDANPVTDDRLLGGLAVFVYVSLPSLWCLA